MPINSTDAIALALICVSPYLLPASAAIKGRALVNPPPTAVFERTSSDLGLQKIP